MNGFRFVAAVDSNIMQIPEIPQSGRETSHLLQLAIQRLGGGACLTSSETLI